MISWTLKQSKDCEEKDKNFLKVVSLLLSRSPSSRFCLLCVRRSTYTEAMILDSLVGASTVVGLGLDFESESESILDQLRAASNEGEGGFDVYTKETTPSEWHFFDTTTQNDVSSRV